MPREIAYVLFLPDKTGEVDRTLPRLRSPSPALQAAQSLLAAGRASLAVTSSSETPLWNHWVTSRIVEHASLRGACFSLPTS
jgi:hypothetical protein